MLPLKLSITGLYSYQKKQTIDFEELTNAGLFGIFGAVGSGKSSVLEAIGFVLYGETERLNSRDKRSYNMLNLKSDKANIEFEFQNFEERKFKFVADWKRNKKRFEETTTIERLAYEWKEEQWIPLTSADATSLIGLTYENFRRTIIIPQGKFKEFLELKGKDRSDMMKEIFHLQRFDLASKVATAHSSARTQLDQLRGALSGFETISKESVAALEVEVTEANTYLQKSKTELELVQVELQKMTVLKTNFEEVEKKKNQLATFIERKPEMEVLQGSIDLFEKTEKAFKQELKELDLAKSNYSKTKEKCISLEKIKEDLDKNRRANQAILTELQPLFDQLEPSKNKVSDLESIEKSIALQTEVAVLEKKADAMELSAVAIKQAATDLKEKAEIIQTELINLKSKKIDGTVLLEVGNWFTKQESIAEQIEVKHKRILTIEKELLAHKEQFEAMQLPKANWKTVVLEKLEQLRKKFKTLQDAKTKLMVSKELADYASKLHDGENCPLCGSLEHPHVMHAEDVTGQLNAVETALKTVETDGKELNAIEKKALKIENDIAHAQEQLRLTFVDKETLESNSKMHLSKFVWESFSATDNAGFLAKKQEQQIIEKAIAAQEQQATTTRSQQEQLLEEVKKQADEKATIANQIAAKSGAITNELSQLKVLAFAEYENNEIALIREEKEKLHQENNRIAVEYKSKSDILVQQNQELAGHEASYKILTEQLVTAEQLVTDNQNKIIALLQTHQFESIDSVQAILSKNWDIEAEKAKTKHFAIDMKVAETAVAAAEKLVENQSFDSKLFEEKKMVEAERKTQFEAQVGKVSALQAELKRIQDSLLQKAELLTQFDVLNMRYTNLGTLSNMFNASGFVNYVSSIYLQNLADVANVRFHRMTKNQLSLTINSSNEFEVIDYLNDGASRSVKTLSGGQGFQASLCLALALAESVQSLNKNDKNFFFIDEGFGTQDPESVAIVFETLQSLYKENRIVGIISHVAELQERIPRSINVVKDEESGSVVSESWG
ncbi:hypothetical protein FFWV33_15950 [Flavobacterium faecale]|uniref:Rad50/SbcC-type AAA domain-containing protein n=1 Tax=Flavobacterium faecale TaxID=1355330 RepID=A0A2S1LGK3_9FLAO|nr:SMC family ATPase [Flavobacterium faecale]AWG22912.1 hypothetical protein FFWV33_15950 [Flavobacterium faecale]